MRARGSIALLLLLGLLIPAAAPATVAKRPHARPTDNPDPDRFGYRVAEHSPPHCTAHFCVHWVDTTADAPLLRDTAPANGVPDYVEQVGAIAETSQRFIHRRLRWRRPASDGTRGGNSKTDIYVKDLPPGGLGVAIPEFAASGFSAPAYLLIEDDFSRREFPGGNPRVLRATTIAHEYAHIIQFSYSAFIDPWFGESTAVWVQQQVFPRLDDYLRFVKRWRRMPGEPLASLKFSKAYGDVVWNLWLAGRFGDEVIRRAWQRAVHTRPRFFSVAAYDQAIRAEGGQGLALEFGRFAAATAEWRAPGVFPSDDARRYPSVRRAGRLTPGEVFRGKLDHTAYALLDVPTASAEAVVLRARIRRGVHSAIALVGRTGTATGGEVVTSFRFMRRGGARTVALPNPQRFERITAVIVNADGRQDGPSDLEGYYYPSNDSRISARIFFRR